MSRAEVDALGERPQVFDMTTGAVSGAEDVSPLGASIRCNTLPPVLCPGRGMSHPVDGPITKLIEATAGTVSGGRGVASGGCPHEGLT